MYHHTFIKKKIRNEITHRPFCNPYAVRSLEQLLFVELKSVCVSVNKL